MYLILNKCKYVISSYIPLKIIEDANLVIDGGKIICIGNCYEHHGYDRINCREKVATPAFGNAHIHITSILKYLNGLDLRKAIAIAIINMISNGIAAFQSVDSEYNVIVEIAKNIGLRIRAGPIVENNECIFPSKDISYDLYSPIISIENLLEIDEEMLENCIKNLLNRNFDIQISVSRTVEETLKFKRKKGFLPIEYLARKNLLSNRIILSHINWVSSWELESIVYYKPKVVICPYGDVLFNINGIPPIKTILERNVVIGIGTETFVYRGSSNMLKDIASIIALYRYSNTNIEMEQAMHLATQGSYNVMNINAGVIETGREADIVIFDIRRLKYGFYTNKQILPLIIHEGYVDTTIVRGNIIWSLDEIDKYVKLLL